MRTKYFFLICFLLIFFFSCEKKEEKKITILVKPKKDISFTDEELMKWKSIIASGTYRTKLIGYGNPFAPFFEEKPRKRKLRALSPLEKWSLKELRLTGIIKKNKKKWALIEDPSGKGYMVSVGTRIGQNEGYIAEIGEDYILIKEKFIDFLGKEIVKDIVIKLRPAEE